MHPNQDQVFRVYADADLSGNWLKEYAEFDLTTAKYIFGWVITDANGLISCASNSHRLC